MLFANLPDRPGVNLLAVSENLLVYSLYEEAFVTDGTNTQSVGSIYGDPACAVIAPDESWCAAAGASLELFRASPGKTLVQAGEAFSLAVPWVEAMWVTGPHALGLVAAPDTQHAHRRLFTLDVNTRKLAPMDGADT
ncbi:MAG: hypothetical protein KDJ73_00720 [Notoacmeibacter sp.]|nr:hypothetical protein [Notoacmeibacter sp.]